MRRHRCIMAQRAVRLSRSRRAGSSASRSRRSTVRRGKARGVSGQATGSAGGSKVTACTCAASASGSGSSRGAPAALQPPAAAVSSVRPEVALERGARAPRSTSRCRPAARPRSPRPTARSGAPPRPRPDRAARASSVSAVIGGASSSERPEAGRMTTVATSSSLTSRRKDQPLDHRHVLRAERPGRAGRCRAASQLGEQHRLLGVDEAGAGGGVGPGHRLVAEVRGGWCRW